MVLSVDPGINHSGVALWSEDGVLQRAWLARSKAKTSDDPAERWKGIIKAVGSVDNVTRLVVERPQIYRHSPGDPNDLITLAAIVGGLVCLFNVPTTLYLPHQWKRNAKKTVTHELIRELLSSDELARVDERPKSLAHNVWDAIGIGLRYYNRLENAANCSNLKNVNSEKPR